MAPPGEDPRVGRRGPRPIVSVTDSAGAVDYATGDLPASAPAVPSVSVRRLGDRFVSYGVGMPPDASILERARRLGLPVIARTTGGTALLHEPGDLAWAIVLSRSDARVPSDYPRAYDRLGPGPVRWLRAYGRTGRWVAAPGAAEEYCTLGSRGQVLEVDGRIVGGAAQHAVKDRLLHHGTISVSVDRPRIATLLDRPEPDAVGRLAGLRDLGLDVEDRAAADSLARAIADELTGD